MTPNEYQAMTRTTAIYPGVGTGMPEAVVYCSLGLVGESGEVAEAVKKRIRKHGFNSLANLPRDQRELLLKELGDVCWYIARLADELGADLDGVLQMNVNKLQDRKDRGVIQGSGDER